MLYPLYEVVADPFNERWYPRLIGSYWVKPPSYAKVKELTFAEYLDLVDPTHDAMGQMMGENK